MSDKPASPSSTNSRGCTHVCRPGCLDLPTEDHSIHRRGIAVQDRGIDSLRRADMPGRDSLKSCRTHPMSNFRPCSDATLDHALPRVLENEVLRCWWCDRELRKHLD